jgi:hypothetical protein
MIICLNFKISEYVFLVKKYKFFIGYTFIICLNFKISEYVFYS